MFQTNGKRENRSRIIKSQVCQRLQKWNVHQQKPELSTRDGDKV